MNIQHNRQANGEWAKKGFLEKYANIGSEVQRAINWQRKGNPKFAKSAFFRSLELIDLTLESEKESSRLRELCNVREAWVDFFMYDNEYNSKAEDWERYFMQLLYAYKMSVGK